MEVYLSSGTCLYFGMYIRSHSCPYCCPDTYHDVRICYSELVPLLLVVNDVLELVVVDGLNAVLLVELVVLRDVVPEAVSEHVLVRRLVDNVLDVVQQHVRPKTYHV